MNNLEFKRVAEFQKTKDHYLIISDTARVSDLNGVCVIYQDYKKCTPTGYVEIPESSRETYIKSKTDFLNNFTLCLDL